MAANVPGERTRKMLAGLSIDGGSPMSPLVLAAVVMVIPLFGIIVTIRDIMEVRARKIHPRLPWR